MIRRCAHALAVVLGVVVAAVVGAGPAAPAGAAQSSPVRFADPALHAVEGQPRVQVVVERTDLPVSRLLVHFRTQDGAGSASAAGGDYVHNAGTLVFEVGAQSASFHVTVRDDEVVEETEHLLLHLETSSGAGASTRLTVLDDDEPPSSSSSASPSSGSATSPSSGSAGRPTGAAAGGASTAPAGAATIAPAPSTPPVVVASSAGVRRQVVPRSRARVAARAPVPRRIILQQTPTTPFELRPSGGAAAGGGVATAVDPLLALGAGLLLARVAAEVWFRARIAVG